MVKFNAQNDIPDLSGKVILVTGGNAGIGLATVRALAAHNPATIYSCSRSVSKGEAAADEIRKLHPKANIKVLQLDLASLKSVRKCAEEFNAQEQRLDLLFLNAGVSGLAPGLTEEGYEMQLGVNHLGHALLTQLLFPKLRNPAVLDPRIIVVASVIGQSMAPKTGVTLSAARTPDAFNSTTARYGRSKLANIQFAAKLAQKYPSITTTSLHPGVVNSDLMGKANSNWIVNKTLAMVWAVVGMTIDQGAETQLWCATAPVGKGGVQSGHYYEPVGKDLTGKSKHSVDQKQIDELWQWTEEELAKHGGVGWPAA